MSNKASEIINKLRYAQKNEKRTLNLYISVKTYEALQAACGKENLVLSKVIEALIDDFLESYKSKK